MTPEDYSQEQAKRIAEDEDAPVEYLEYMGVR